MKSLNVIVYFFVCFSLVIFGAAQTLDDPKSLDDKQALPITHYKALSEFDGIIIQQIEIDKDFPCYLQPDLSILCLALTDNTKILELASKQNLSKGIPVYDNDKYDVVNDSTVPKVIYLDYTKNNIIKPDWNTITRYAIGFESNIYVVSTYTNGAYGNTTTRSTSPIGVYLNHSISTDLRVDLILEYLFSDDDETTTADSSGRGKTGNVVNSTWTQEGRYGGAILFNNSNPTPYNKIVNSTAGGEGWTLRTNTPLTISFWANQANKTNAATFFADYKRIRIRQTNILNSPECTVYNIIGTTTVYGRLNPINKGEWHHIVCVYNLTHVILYMDGQQLNATELPGGFVLNSTFRNAAIGGEPQSGLMTMINPFNGTIDEFRVWNRSLSATELSSLYNQRYASYGYYYNNYTSVAGTFQPSEFIFNATIQENSTVFVDVGTNMSTLKLRCNNTNTTCNISSLPITSNLTYNFTFVASSDKFNTSYLWNYALTYDYANATSPNSCTCPGLNQNWVIDLADNCALNTSCNLGTGRLNFTGTGNFYLNSSLNTTSMGYPPSGGIIWIMSVALLKIY